MKGRKRPCCAPWRWASRKATGGFTWMRAGGWPISCANAGLCSKNSGSHLPSLAFIDSLLEAIQQSGDRARNRASPVEQRTSPTTAHLEDGLPISLSAREMEVLALIAEGKSNQEISAELYLALNTVKRHAYNIYAKLEVKKRTQAVSKARQLGLIP